jgi:hypothetical protein
MAIRASRFGLTSQHQAKYWLGVCLFKETLNKSFDKLRTNGKWLISFVVK